MRTRNLPPHRPLPHVHAPFHVVRSSMQEQYLPCSVRWFFERSRLVSVEGSEREVAPRVLLSRAETTPERVASAPLRAAM